jgi:hypothetical protein
MQAARCAPALCGGKHTDLAVGIASHQSNSLAARLNGTENRPKMSGDLANVGLTRIRQMKLQSNTLALR